MSTTWHNWSGSVTAQPEAIRYPATREEIVAIVRDARARGANVRVVGAGHSFTPLAQTDGVLISLDRYAGLESVDAAARQATVRAGTKIKTLGELLFAHGLAQENLGDIDVQSIAGAISTGTHGTGITLGSISTQVVGLTLVTGRGDVLECSEEQHRDLFRAAQVSIGALGIIISVRLQLVPTYRLDYTWSREPLSVTLEHLERERDANRNFEFYWFPYSEWALVKRMNITDAPARSKNLLRRFNDLVMENGAFWLLSEIARRFPSASPRIARLCGALVSGGRDMNHSHKVFATTRLVRFNEMEYSLPAARMADAIRAIDACIRRERFRVHFPIECRYVRGDDIYLSPANGRDSAYIAVHMYRRMAYREYFAAVEAIFRDFGGRPHWGKMHMLTAAELCGLYPHWARFQAARRQLDPDGVLQNAYLNQILGDLAAQPAEIPARQEERLV
jgi:FAD-linked oxidoreductase